MGSHRFLTWTRRRRNGLTRLGSCGRPGLALVAVLLAAAPILAAPASTAAQSPAITTSPAELVRQAVACEVAASEDASLHHRFRSRKLNAHGGSQTKLYVETRDAMVGMVIAYDDHPLSETQKSSEEARLQSLLDHPEQLRRKRSQEKEDADRSLRIVKALPDAFLYENDGIDIAKDFGKPGDTLVRLKFRPNPNYNPPSREEQVLSGMEGTLLIDVNQHRLAKIDGTLFKDVSFGWGILAWVRKGGSFVVEQSDLGDGSWEITRMTLNFSGKILLFKSFSVASDEVLSDFHRVPADITFAQGVELLKQEEIKIAQNNAGKSR